MYKLRRNRIILLGLGVISLTIAISFVIFSTSQQTAEPENNQNESTQQIEEVLETLIISNDTVPEENTPEVPDPPVQEIELSSWIAYWDLYGAIDTYKDNIDNIHSLSPTWYFIQTDGSLGLKNTARNSEIRTLCDKNNTMLIPSISNSNADSLSLVLNDSTLLGNHINAIVSEVTTYNYDGIDIDYEAIRAEDKDAFSNFIKLLAEQLHAKNKVLTIAILWKNDLAPLIDMTTNSRAAQDWTEIGKHVDEFRIMGYEYTHSYDTAGPIAPKEWLQSILDYAVGKVDAEKIVLGLPLYAYEWTEGVKGAKALVWNDVQNRKSTFKSTVMKDEVHQEFMENELRYQTNGITKIIWYQNSTVTQKRIELAQTYGIFRFAFWRMGGEDPMTYKL